VRPCLEYGNIIWGSNYKVDEERKATKLVPSISHLPYEERLQYLGLPSLKYRRFRGDMIMMYNTLHGHLNIDKSILFMRSWNRTTIEVMHSSCLNHLPSEKLAFLLSSGYIELEFPTK